MASLLWFIIILLALAWALGFAVNIGAWIHVLLVLAVILLVVNVVTPLLHQHPATGFHDHDVRDHDIHDHDVHDHDIHHD